MEARETHCKGHLSHESSIYKDNSVQTTLSKHRVSFGFLHWEGQGLPATKAPRPQALVPAAPSQPCISKLFFLLWVGRFASHLRWAHLCGQKRWPPLSRSSHRAFQSFSKRMPLKVFLDIYSSGDGPSTAALLEKQLLADCCKKCASKESVGARQLGSRAPGGGGLGASCHPLDTALCPCHQWLRALFSLPRVVCCKITQMYMCPLPPHNISTALNLYPVCPCICHL